MMRASKMTEYGSAAPSLEEVRALAAIEMHRLHDTAGAASYERRELLEDLASRLSVLVTGLTELEFAPLRKLVAVLEGDGSLDEKWAAAVETLTTFVGGVDTSPVAPGGQRNTGGSASPRPENSNEDGPHGDDGGEPARKPFWKR
jgi:Ca-activated chloride channel homolog